MEDDHVGGMPDWAIAVVVIGVGSFAFVIIFGMTVVRISSLYFQLPDQKLIFSLIRCPINVEGRPRKNTKFL